MHTRVSALTYCILALFFFAAVVLGRARAQADRTPPSPRTWTTRDGKYKVSATFLELKRVVRVQKTDGSVVSVDIEQLSDADQEYIREHTGDGKAQPAQLPFREDFSKYKDDDVPNGWGLGVKVRKGADERNWLVASAKGQHPVGRDVDLPTNAYIEFEFGAEMLEKRRGTAENALSGINLVDETGAKYRIEWTVKLNDQGSQAGDVLTLPGGTEITYYHSSSSTHVAGKLRIRKTGDTITLTVIADDAHSMSSGELSGNLRDFKRFKRFEVDAYRGPNSAMSFTNFRIGKLE